MLYTLISTSVKYIQPFPELMYLVAWKLIPYWDGNVLSSGTPASVQPQVQP